MPGGLGARPAHAWIAELQRTQQGGIKTHEANVEVALRFDPHLHQLVAYNEFSNQLERLKPIFEEGRGLQDAGRRPWRDQDTTDLAIYLQRSLEANFRPEVVLGATLAHARRECAYHPVRQYLNGLKWDGENRLDIWLSGYCGATGDQTYLRLVSRMFPISAVARIYKPGCQVDSMLILEGNQGNMKSGALIALFSPWINESGTGDLTKRDAEMALQGSWCVLADELADMAKAEARQLKTFLTRRVDKFRPPYGKGLIEFPRQCVFAGTTNDETYLRDSTGGRRFWPVQAGEIDLASLKHHRDQIWAEAVAAFKVGERWHPEGKEVRLFAGEQEQRQEEDPWIGVIEEFVERRRENGALRATVREALAAVGASSDRQNQVAAKRMVGVFKRLRFRKQDPERRSPVNYWVFPPKRDG